eukprot:jgi/Hompol1/4304/HPOL_003580-RA
MVYDPASNTLTELVPIDGVYPVSAYDTTNILVRPTHSSFQLFVYGVTTTWTSLTYGPVGIQRGVGVYQSSINAIQIYGGYPLSFPTNIISGGFEFVYEYSLYTHTWTQWAQRSLSHNRVLQQAEAFTSDYAITYGGMEMGWDATRIGDDCYSGELQILDMVRQYRRMGFGMIVRGTSIVLVGGSTGILQNDVITIDLNSVPPTDSSQVGMNPSPLQQGATWYGMCPAGSNPTKSHASCATLQQIYAGTLVNGNVSYGGFADFTYLINDQVYDIVFTITSLSPQYAQLRITLLSFRPYTPTSISGALTDLASDVYRPLGLATLRVSWGNDQGVYVANPSTLVPADSYPNQNAQFQITAGLFQPPQNPTVTGFQMSDIVYLCIVFAISILISLTIVYTFKHIRDRMIRRRLEAMEAVVRAQMPESPPPIYGVTLDLFPKSRFHRSGVLTSLGGLPTSVAASQQMFAPSAPPMPATIDPPTSIDIKIGGGDDDSDLNKQNKIIKSSEIAPNKWVWI